MKLNLGSGATHLQGFVNVDLAQDVGADVVWDLNHTPWEFASSGSCEEILMSHVLEHLGPTTGEFLAIMQELYRVLTLGGTLTIKVPHPFSDAYLGDPTHVRPITPGVLSLFSKKNCLAFAERSWPNTPLALRLGIDLEIASMDYALMPYWGEKVRAGAITEVELNHAISTYNNVVDQVTIVLYKAS